MSNILDNLSFNGQQVSILFPFSFVLPDTVHLMKVDETTVQLTVTYTIKVFFVKITRTSTVLYNLSTGSLKVTA